MASSTAIRAGKAFVELFTENSKLVRGLRAAEISIRKFGDKIKKMGVRLTVGVSIASAPLANALRVFADFDDQMRAVKASIGATAEEFKMLTEKAELLGRTTSFTAAEVAGSMLELGRAGFDPKMIDNAMASVLDLARATGTDLSQATEMAVNTMYSFELSATEMSRVCDVMVAAANGSAMTLEDMSAAMSYSAPIASAYGLTLEQTAKAIGALSNYGIKASQAGTTLRRILTNLADPRIQEKLQGLGVNTVDFNTGKLRDVSATLRDLGKRIQDMPDAKKLGLYKELFGLYAISGGAKLTVAQFDSLIEAVDNAAGAAGKAAKEMDGGLGGSLRMLWSAVEGVNIAIGKALAPSFQKIVDIATYASAALVEFIKENEKLIVAISKTLSAVGAFGVGMITLGVALKGTALLIGSYASAISAVGMIAKTVFTVIGPMILAMIAPMLAATAAVVGIGLAAYAIYEHFDLVKEMVMSAWNSLKNFFAGLAKTIVDAFQKAGQWISGAFQKSVQGVVSTAGSIRNAFTKLPELFAAIGNRIKEAFSAVGDYLMQFYDVQMVVGYGRVVATVFQTVSKIIKTTITSIKDALSGAYIISKAVSQQLGRAAKVVISVWLDMTRSVFSLVAKVVQNIASVVNSVISTVLSGIRGVISGIMSVLGPVVTKIRDSIVSVFTSLASLIARPIKAVAKPLAGIATAVASMFVKAFGFVKKTLGSLISNVISFARKFLVFEIAYKSVIFLGRALGATKNLIGTLFSTFAQNAAALPGILSKIPELISGWPKAIGSVFGGLVQIVTNIFGGIKSSFSGALGGLWNIANGVFTGVSGLVTNFGNFFIDAFSVIKNSVGSLMSGFSELWGIATETFSGIATAISAGDITAAVNLLWASIKLIWYKGSEWIVNMWFVVSYRLQTVWANAVYGMSSALLQAWYGVQEFWTETVYVMSTLWAEFSTGVVSAWKTAEKAVAKGIGYLIAKMEGLDPAEMAKQIEDDYSRQAKQREDTKQQKLSRSQASRDVKMQKLQEEKSGVLDVLREDYERKKQTRDEKAYSQSGLKSRELINAQDDYREALENARNAPQRREEEEEKKEEEKKQAEAIQAMKSFARSAQAVGDSASSTTNPEVARRMGYARGNHQKQVERSLKNIETFTAGTQKNTTPVKEKGKGKEQPQENVAANKRFQQGVIQVLGDINRNLPHFA